jgi:hypothetical protein
VIVSDQMRLDGVVNKISAVQSNEDILLNPDTGIVYVESVKFGEAVGFFLESTLDNPNAFGTSANDNFGNSVAISGDYAIVGAYLESDASGTGSGKAYIFNVTTGALVHTLNNPNPFGTSASDNFGNSVAISGEYAIVGAANEDEAGGPASGKAYIFNVTTGALVHTLNNPNAFGPPNSDFFGRSVAISDNYAIVGVSSEDDAGGTGSGKAYIFNVITGALVHTLNNPNAFGTTTDDNFGWSVAISGNYAIVSARDEDDIDGNFSGKAYVFNVTTGALFNTLDNPNAFGTSNEDRFGFSVAISGDRAIVGARDEDDASGTNSGKAYIYKIDRPTITNLLNTPLTFASTGIGYTRFVGDNAVLIPVGDNSQQRANPEVGETRWNTEVGYLECFDGTVWNISTGGGDEVTTVIMEDFGHAYTLMLG